MDAFPEKGVQQAVERRKTASIEPFELDFDDIHEDDGLQAVCRMRFVSVVADSLSCVDHCGPMTQHSASPVKSSQAAHHFDALCA